MSVLLIGKVYGLDLSQDKQAVLLALADEANDDGYCRPSRLYLAWKTGYEQRHVRRILKLLESGEKPLIQKVGNGGGRGHAAEYKLNLNNGTPKKPYHEWKEKQIEGKSSKETMSNCHTLSDVNYDNTPQITESEAINCDKSPQIKQLNNEINCGTHATPPLIKDNINYIYTPPTPSHETTDSPPQPESVCVSASQDEEINKPFSRPADSTEPILFGPANAGKSQTALTAAPRGETANVVSFPIANKSSRHDEDTLRRYAAAHGLGIGWIVKATQTGGFDSFVDDWSVQQSTTAPPQPSVFTLTVDTKQCPECGGSGWVYPTGQASDGVRRCTHKKLMEGAA